MGTGCSTNSLGLTCRLNTRSPNIYKYVAYQIYGWYIANVKQQAVWFPTFYSSRNCHWCWETRSYHHVSSIKSWMEEIFCFQTRQTEAHSMPNSRQSLRTCCSLLFRATSANGGAEGISNPGIFNRLRFASRSQTCNISYVPAGNPILHTIFLAWLSVPVRGKQVAPERAWQIYLDTGKISPRKKRIYAHM